MHMTGLERLARSMIALGIDIQQFLFVNGAATFDCLFSMRGDFELTMTSRGENPKFFQFQITDNFQMSAYLGDLFLDLMSVLKTHGMSTNEFKSSDFFQALNAAVPHEASPDRAPTPQQILTLRHDLEERDRPFFDAWIYWGPDRGPTASNLKKTLIVFGPDAMQFSLRNRASSRWSANDLGRAWQG